VNVILSAALAVVANEADGGTNVIESAALAVMANEADSTVPSIPAALTYDAVAIAPSVYDAVAAQLADSIDPSNNEAVTDLKEKDAVVANDDESEPGVYEAVDANDADSANELDTANPSVYDAVAANEADVTANAVAANEADVANAE